MTTIVPSHEIGDSLLYSFPSFRTKTLHRLARQNDRFQRICQFIDVKYFDALELGRLY